MIGIEKLDSVDPEETVGFFGGSGQWISVATVKEVRLLLSAKLPVLENPVSQGMLRTQRTMTIAWLRDLAAKGGRGVVNNIDARCLGRIADDLERINGRGASHRRKDRL